jgi:hypothetical protein
MARRYVAESAAELAVDVCEWHDYALEWRAGGVTFSVDGAVRFEAAVAPRPPLGLVLWIDSQFAAFPPDGRLRYGNLAWPEPAWLELAAVTVTGPGGRRSGGQAG